MFGHFQNNLCPQKIIGDAVWERRPKVGGLPCFPRAPEESGLALRKTDPQCPRDDILHEYYSISVQLKWNIIHSSSIVNQEEESVAARPPRICQLTLLRQQTSAANKL
jgi:hypothetical protein